jgi:1-deoxy-D-xylulose-5-phosphate synthase
MPATGRSYTAVLSDYIVKLAQQNDKIVAITSAMCAGTGLRKFKEKYPQRFYDVGIAESAAVDIAAGLAKSGLKPVVCIYSTFLQRSFDQIFQEVSLQNLPMVFCIDRAGLVGADGPTHHGLMDIGFLRMLPNMVLVGPANAKELELALDFAMDCDSPVAIRYPKDIVPKDSGTSACNKPFKVGKSVTVKSSSSSKVAIVNYGCLLNEALMAADKLKTDGIDVDVINARFASPIDRRIVKLAGEGKCLVTVEDHFVDCGFGSAVLEAVSQAGFEGARVKITGIERGLVKHDTRDSQLAAAGINADGIAKTVKELIAKSRD